MKHTIEKVGSLTCALLCILVLSSCNEGLEANLETAEFTDTENEAMVAEIEECSGDHANFHLAKELGRDLCGDWKSKLPDCAVVTESDEGYPKTITIEMGDDCEGRHGRKRSGTTIITLSDDMKNEGAVRTMVFEKYGMDDHSVKGTKTIVNQGLNGNGNYVFKRTTTMSGTGKRGDFERKSEGYIEWMAGFDTDDCYDNVLSITGSSTTTKDGESVRTRMIQEALIKDVDCKHFTKGLIEVSGSKGTSTIDFGDGTCDAIAIMTKDGVETEIDLTKAKERKGQRRPRRKK